jgi:hypothetical protein
VFDGAELRWPDLDALLSVNAALVEALKPLAECEIIDCDVPLLDSDSSRYFMTMGEIRAARAALNLARSA